MEAYKTTDFYLAAFLFVNGNRINETNLIGRSTTEFEFAESNELKKEVEKFYTMKASVDPLTYGSALRSIKSMIHALKEAHTTSNSKGTTNNANNKHRNEISRG